jgi:hypothetical protein
MLQYIFPAVHKSKAEKRNVKVVYFLCVTSLFLFYGCNNSTTSNNPFPQNDTVTLNSGIKNDSPKNSGAINSKDSSNLIATTSCGDMLKRLIKSSSLDSAVRKMDFDLQIDHVDSGVVTIELTLKNTERNDDVALSWIEMDLNKTELRDIAVDPDNPVNLNFDKQLFLQIAKSCNWQ